MPQNAFFPKLAIFWSAKKQCKDTFFSTHHPLSPVIFATATVVAFVLLCNSRFNFHCYTQCEANLLRNRPGNDAATTCNFLRERLQRAFTRANQLHWTVQYRCRQSEKNKIQQWLEPFGLWSYRTLFTSPSQSLSKCDWPPSHGWVAVKKCLCIWIAFTNLTWEMVCIYLQVSCHLALNKECLNSGLNEHC